MIPRPLTQDERDALTEYLLEAHRHGPCLVELRSPLDADWYFVFVNRRLEGVLCGD